MSGFIDIHHHLLFGIDDGPKDEMLSRKMADMAAGQGIDTIFATPHACPGVRKFEREICEERIALLNEYCRVSGYDTRILCGAEVRYSQAMVRCLEQGEIPTMNNTRFVLTEWSDSEDASLISRAVREISNAGYIVIMAHVERCGNLWRKAGLLEELKADFDVRIQVDCGSLLARGIGTYRMRRFVDRLLEKRLVDYVATDAHDISVRPARMDEAYRYIRKRYGGKYARAVTGQNQQELTEPVAEQRL